jgi:hypothetical protein
MYILSSFLSKQIEENSSSGRTKNSRIGNYDFPNLVYVIPNAFYSNHLFF